MQGEKTIVKLKSKRWREEKGIGLKELSEKTKTKEYDLERIEKNEMSPTLDQVYQISMLLGIDFWELLDLPDDL